MRARGSVAHALAGAAALALLAGCSSDGIGPDIPTREPATAAAAPVPTANPSGSVASSGPIADLVVESGSGKLAVLDTAGTTLSILDPAARGDNPPGRTVVLPAAAAAVAQGAPGQVLLPARGRVLRVDLASGAVTEIPVEGDAVAVRYREDGAMIVGAADGSVRTLSDAGEVRRTVTGLVSADAVAPVADRIAVLDRHQTSVTEIGADSDHLGLALRAGDGAARMIADHYGRVMVTDTAGGELLVYTTEPLVLRQRFPVGSSPYALAYDRRSETVWVTCTQSNEVLGFDLSTGIPKEVGRFSTVRQPDSVTVDDRSGDLFVGSATGDGLQRIAADERKRGQ
ncbi:YncE family protein [Nocardia bovistercoris]|uniref:Streptogramin lyase n=1 Tax=Nocardia bovistercoris TaxID=2785916 RepID=A0A931N564_9NOCA|nr:hypothetical protein [Nocardia bovistercoris]MBH0779524.1 hypothetical protein [Nocardia bovistercoris]